MAEVIMFPDVIKAVVPWLRLRLTARGSAASAFHRVPEPRPDRLVVIEQLGGQRLDLIRREVRLLVQCWDTDEPAASRLAEICSSELEAVARSRDPIAPGVWIAAEPEDFSVPVNFPDPLTNSPRYQFTANLVLTGSAI